MLPIDGAISILGGFVVLITYAIVRCLILWRKGSPANRRSCITAILAIPLLIPSLSVFEQLDPRDLPFPRFGLPDLQSGDAVRWVVCSVALAYLAAFVLVRSTALVVDHFRKE